MAIPAWAVSQCDDGHGSVVGCARLLLPSAAERRNLFVARLLGMPESFSLSWPECGRTGAFQAVQFSSMSTVRDKGIGGSECWQSSAAMNPLIRMCSFSKQSEGMSNSVPVSYTH